jgi:hypothetical protein
MTTVTIIANQRCDRKRSTRSHIGTRTSFRICL